MCDRLDQVGTVFEREDSMRSTLVSVIIIFLNAENFVNDAIESVFAQIYENWELLLVDDGSTDASTEVALRWAKENPGKVRYLEHNGHQNRGMSASRNLGIANARGEYIAFLDADDVWLPHTLEQQVAILESHPEAAMVYGPAKIWRWTGNPEDIQLDKAQKLVVQPNTVINPPMLLTLFLQDENAVPIGPLVRREAIERVGGFEDSFRGMYEDQVFFAKVCLKLPVFVAAECWYRYRRHPDSSCALAVESGQYHSARLAFLNWLAGYLACHEVKISSVRTVLKKELWPYRHPTLHRLSRMHFGVAQAKGLLKLVARWTLPASIRRRLRAQWERYKRRTATTNSRRRGIHEAP